MVDIRIIYTYGVGEVRKPRLPGEGRVYLFLGFTINSDSDEIFNLAILYTRFKLLYPYDRVWGDTKYPTC